MSKDEMIHFKRDSEAPGPGPGPGLSCESMQSDRSKDWGSGFKEAPSEDTGAEWSPERLRVEPLLHVFTRLEEQVLSFVKEQLKRFHRVLASDYPECLESEGEEQSSREAVRTIALDFLKRMKQEDVAERLSSKSLAGVCRDKLKRRLQQRLSCVSEGVAKAGNPTPLNQIYTELYITEGGAEGVNQEHEVRHIQTKSRRPAAPETTITCEDMFKFPAHKQGPIREDLTERPIRSVLTKGVAGVGKTVLTQKFSLDWAEGRANQDVQLLFPFTFRKLNVLRERQFSLVGLMHHFFSEAKGLCSFDQLQVLFIFDGLDECRLPLDFSQTQVLTEITECVSLDALLVNLIRGSLLPSARLWITTRPAAANQIPAVCVSMVTEVRGFTDPQKEQYFRKRFRDEQKATDVISHIKTSRSLYIMCHLPVFCWMTSTVLDHEMKTGVKEQMPQTLTQMYIHFLVVQAKVKGLKYDGRSETDPHWTPETRKMVKSLGKVAFEQLQKGNLIFYDSDLVECGLAAAGASVYSGVFTQVFREEPGLYQDKVYCFIHLSVQEFLAALHVHLTFYNSGNNLLLPQQTTQSLRSMFKKESPELFYRSAVDQALKSPNGHLDLFLRFLLGLSLPTNQSLLLGLTQTGSSSETNKDTVKYIKEKLDHDISSESQMNLLHCLNELHDHSLVEQVQSFMREGRFSDKNMSVPQWSTVAFLLLFSSDSDLEEFDLKKYDLSSKAFNGLLPVIKASRKVILSSCKLNAYYCDGLDTVLCSSSLTHLDLSNNDLRDSGVKRLCSGLKNAPCRLEVLSLSLCGLSEDCFDALASVISSSSLTHLDLSNNHLKDSGVERLCSGLKSAPCRLEVLSLSWCGLSEDCCDALASVLSSSSLTHLDLSNNDLEDSGVERLSSGVKSAPWRLEVLSLSWCGLSEDCCDALASVLSSSSLTHLDLSNNDLKDSGVNRLCSGLKSAPCRLEVLRLSGCLVSRRGGVSLASALSSAHSHLTELDLSYNHPGPSAELLTTLRDDPHCPLQSLRLDPAGERCMVPGPRKYFCHVTLDPNTANDKLELSVDKRTVTNVEQLQLSPSHQDRFSSCPQVLSSTALTGRCYWEVETRGFVEVAVSYRGIRRRGDAEDCRFGDNDQSWSLRRDAEGGLWSVYHCKRRTYSCYYRSDRVGVFLDSAAGALSFYMVLDDYSLYLLRSFIFSSSEPLFVGFGLVAPGSSVSLVEPTMRR
ncbi:NACHT, LRR and PYD domains-containing protein 3-like isoform X3 [Eucyclogobius newberryi]|uniref:NACHT, LRR and PYD domains-containing protein 3-like isoform X3 n=1 Tax=Eucyclogobius newberryi TaxID=166745 RepID=UPI003B5B821E